MMNKKISIHFIEEDKNEMLAKIIVSNVPRVGDEVRFGGQGNEKFYTVTMVIWVYDEPDHPYDRVNIGVEETRLSKFNGKLK